MAEPASSKETSLVTIEGVFDLIRKGNASNEAHDYWKAATTYCEVQQQLRQLITENDTTTNTVSREEQAQIQKLYHAQCVEYLNKARKSLIEALTVDTNDDTNDETQPSRLLENLDESSVADRLHLFGSLFAGPLPETTSKEITATEQSLQERLANLNSQLPSSLKTEKERIQDLNRGLRRLGLAGIDDGSSSKSTPFGPNSAFNVDMVPPKSEDEQVDDIIDMVNDEIKLDRPTAPGDNSDTNNDTIPSNNDNNNNKDDDNGSNEGATLLDLAARAASGENVVESTAVLTASDSVGSVSDGDDDDNSLDMPLTPQQVASLHEQLAEAQVQLSTLTAMFQVDEDESAEVEFDPSTGKHLLRNVRTSLQKVSDQWKASI